MADERTPAGQPELAEQTVLVTGAASGIGRTTALAFGAAGARVVLADIDEAGAHRIARQIEDRFGAEPLVHRADLADGADILGLYEAIDDAYGGVDSVANVAAIYPNALTVDTSDEFWDRVLTLNLRGVFQSSREALRRMVAQGHGSVVNIASGAAFKGLSGLSAYSASKGGLVAMSRVMAVEVARQGVRVNVVAPGPDANRGRGRASQRRGDCRRRRAHDPGPDDATRGGRGGDRVPVLARRLRTQRRDSQRQRRRLPADRLVPPESAPTP